MYLLEIEDYKNIIDILKLENEELKAEIDQLKKDNKTLKRNKLFLEGKLEAKNKKQELQKAETDSLLQTLSDLDS